MKPPFPYFGGKQRVADQIIDLFPAREGYVEPYAGGLSVLLAKPRSVLEVVNDLNGHLVTFWRVLRDSPEELQRVCDLTPHARDEFDLSLERDGLDDIETARRVWVLMTQGRSAIWKNTGWRHYKNGAASSGFATYMAAYRDRLHPCAERLRDVQIECRPGVQLIETYGAHAANLLYVDPPYLGTTRRNVSRYAVEMKDAAQHHDMLDALLTAKGPVVLSGYANEIYEARLPDWQRVELEARTQGGDRTEVLWLNPLCAALIDQEAQSPQLWKEGASDG